ncbi:uncharacterized protein M7bp isoform X5 [Diachasmimorpha longicaudata]|uniref:uncharacterized protein M7bp isoform X5 n=1 Tax=Diachasmimorpha longicaudata TaxID=58733 RepID=UPI0030B8B868
MKSNELNFKMILPPATVGILVVASGICFILFNSFRRGKTGADKNEKKVPVDDRRCACCLKPFIIGGGVQCSDCSTRFCRKGCGRWVVKDNVWRCLICYHRSTWSQKKEKCFDTLSGVPSREESRGQFRTAKSPVYVAGVEHGIINSGVELAADGDHETDTLENIREIIEKVVESLVGSVDNAPIDRLYQHSSYDQFFEDFGVHLTGALAHLAVALRMCMANKPATDTPSMAHTALRELVERAVDEARKLPGLGDSVTIRRQNNTSISDEQSYEDLLAAAILNKVVEKYQKGRVDGNSNVVREITSKRCRHRGSEASASGIDEGSSADPMSQDECSSECSRTKTKLRIRQEPLSLTIEEQIEEVTTTYTSDEEPRNVKANVLHFRNAKRVPFPEFGMDIVDPSHDSSEESEDDACVSVDHITPLETWEQNWLFQRKKIAAQPEPVAMLVPNPSEDYRALIGDKDADDMSDLSEFSAQSDEEADEDLIEAINQVVPASPQVVRVPSGVQKTKSAILHDNFTGEIMCEDSNDLQSPDESTSGPKIELEIGKKEKNPERDLKINDTEIEVTREGENYGRRDTTGNTDIKEDRNKVPKTPTATPTRNSICEGDLAQPVTCDLQKLNEKLIAIDDSDNNEDEAVDHLKPHSPDVERQLELEKSEQFLHNDVENGNTLKNERSPLENGETLNNVSACQAAAVAAKAKPTSSVETKSNEEGQALSAPPRPGTIAEREHKKWENAAPIQNNPYSEENIQKRLLERQYARRSSDAPGSGVLPTSPSPPLKIVLGGNRPDVQRFARDYYINESKSPMGERHRRPGTSNSSRPSSSLSQNSASTSSDYEHQVSQRLEQFEEASLRGSLHRSTYSSPYASSNFVINPLVYLNADDSDRPTARDLSIEIEPDMSNESKDTVKTISFEVMSDAGTADTAPTVNSTINPIYEDENHHWDSGIYSMDSFNSQPEPKNIPPSRLSWTSEDHRGYPTTQDYWMLDAHKFQTFGGISQRKPKKRIDQVFEDVDDFFLDTPPREQNPDVNFSGLKFQTFGGIKRTNKFDKNRIGSYRKPRVKSAMDCPSTDISLKSNRSDLHNQQKSIPGTTAFEGDECLRLEPPLVPKIIERNYTSLIDLQRSSSVRRKPSRKRRFNPEIIFP